jgi:hypothetical protein
LKNQINENTLSTIPKKEICEICDENDAKNFCFECKKLFCDEDLTYVHKVSHIYENHPLCTIEEYIVLKHKKEQGCKKFLCHCSAKMDLMFFCQKDQQWICKCCAKWEHENHEKIQKPEEIRDDLPDHLKKLLISFQSFEKNMMKNIKNTIEGYKQKSILYFDQIINLAQTLKQKIEEKSNAEIIFRESQISLMRSSLLSFYQDVENRNSVHPNKLLQIKKFADSKNEEMFMFKEFDLILELENLKETEEVINSLQNIKTRIEQVDYEIIKFKNNFDESDEKSIFFLGHLLICNYFLLILIYDRFIQSW